MAVAIIWVQSVQLVNKENKTHESLVDDGVKVIWRLHIPRQARYHRMTSKASQHQPNATEPVSTLLLGQEARLLRM